MDSSFSCLSLTTKHRLKHRLFKPLSMAPQSMQQLKTLLSLLKALNGFIDVNDINEFRKLKESVIGFIGHEVAIEVQSKTIPEDDQQQVYLDSFKLNVYSIYKELQKSGLQSAKQLVEDIEHFFLMKPNYKLNFKDSDESTGATGSSDSNDSP
ncbi:uncharacterized protein LOC128957637 [Oppia nitens]|uniref:uncharacterized protein LOC128957637 n=1 Tax=Oppia nitens TaxID=1686743 RepID=UPI0023DC534F|nr:uncharacterized protein LOC128957637 [Oppia nitens]